jgi:hypothetical protein
MIKFNYRDSDMVLLPGETTCICGALRASVVKIPDELRNCDDYLRRLLRWV